MKNSYISKEDKRLMKPVIEKRRRDRINQSLEHLRTLLLEATQDESLKNPKTEKADILKKTVEFLRMCNTPDSEVEKNSLPGFEGGFQEGLCQATQFLNSSTNVCEDKRTYLVGKLYQHLEDKCINRWKEPMLGDNMEIDHRQLLPSPPQISRVTGDLETSIEKCPHIQTNQPLIPTYPSSSSIRPLSQSILQSSPRKPQGESCKMSVQRTILPTFLSNASMSPAFVWRPWP
ncbi:transcription factor HES-4 [Bombina bombina]|uniref:transcription factor HES-4 n=1 Tax=Bombina bombina TaxID=8345 RepID=UPI00235A88E0|nr:transcription factor HES-4 [Bombina bombina]